MSEKEHVKTLERLRDYGMTYIATDFEALLDGLRSPSDPPAPSPSSGEPNTTNSWGIEPESVEDRKCACDSDGLCKYHGELEDRAYRFAASRTISTTREAASMLTSFAQSEIARQTPAIIERFVEEVSKEADRLRQAARYSESFVGAFYPAATQIVKARRSVGDEK